MRIPVKIECDDCGAKRTKWILVDQIEFSLTCKCGIKQICWPCSSRGERLLLYRAAYEFCVRKDYSMAIILAAMSVEIEMYDIYCKHHDLDRIKKGEYVPMEDVEEYVERLFLEHGNVIKRLNKASDILSGGQFNKYIHCNKELKSELLSGFPSIDIHAPTKSFHEALFFPRNRILHYGYQGYKRREAIKSFNCAAKVLYIFQEMEKRKLGF